MSDQAFMLSESAGESVPCACGKPATANGRECPAHFRARLLSVRLDTSVTETRTKRNYFDREALAGSFGDDARERYMEETKGLGAGYRDERGELVRRGPDGQPLPISERDLDDVYLSGPEVDDV